MKIVNTIARILLGLLFLAGGLGGLLMKPPPMPGLAGAFNAAFSASHWSAFVAVAQIVAAVLLLANRYVPVALIIIAGFLYNSFAFHITMLPTTVFAPIVATALWVLTALPYRSLFAPIFRAKA